MQRKSVGTVILSLARSSVAGVFGLLLLANTSLSQTFDNFLFVGVPGAPAGTVTSLSLTDTIGTAVGAADIGQISYFGAAGLSSVFTLTARPSAVLSGQTQVYASTDASFVSLQLSDLHDVDFYTGELTHDTGSVPPNWFRLTHHEGIWSGVFRVGNQVYALNRENASDVVEVRSTLSDAVSFNPSLRARVSAVLNTGYFLDDTGPEQSSSIQNKQVAALESIHVLDGLLSDSLGLTLNVEQIVLDNVFNATDLNASPDADQDKAIDWKQQQQSLFGTDDKLATLFFTGQQSNDTAANQKTNDASVVADNAIILQPHSSDHQFATAHSFGKLLGLSEQPGTLQDWQQTGLVSLPAVHWSPQQQDEFEANPPASRLLQVLSNDQPATGPDLLPEPAALDPVLVESDSEERGVTFPQNDPATTNAATTSGGGAAFWLLLVTLAFFRQPVALAISAR